MEKLINQDGHRQDYNIKYNSNGKREKYTLEALRSSHEQAGADYPKLVFHPWNKAATFTLIILSDIKELR